MKHISHFILVVTALFMVSCEGEPGPPGPAGPPGGLLVSSAFEIEIDFNAQNNYSFIESYGFTVFPSDVTLVYILWDTLDGQDIWRLLPQSVEFDDGTLIYNYDFTQIDVSFFLDGTTNFDALGPEWTQNQVFRVVVIPADNVDSIDVSNLNIVMQSNGIENFNVRSN
ncbi:hypothetical protein SAMN04515667_2290 [Formosa sp. Hel1_31_208]|uniref:hypothetical protein n=1 Tax=Formosa sp. Hel1_31_208 TaxID=1798225 RepID=UPI0008793794|nr:hypothetical protein [Formosa sp. Hel1_31_208]SDS48921.1 hypothetical protein SAMN04515667_2290 [Formosa sp. Hel1_31_208]